VKHHSQLLSELIAQGRLSAPQAGNDSSLAIHDPCYLARANDDVHSIRMVAKFTGVNVQELPRHGKKTSCCGAGGGRMWVDEVPNQRVSKGRADEVLASGVRRLATGCPFCLNMMTDALASAPADKSVQVLDIAEILLASRVPPPGETTSASISSK
jgi:Fe-S oxidoreductase